MLTYDELVKEVNQLPLPERLSLLEAITKSVKDEVTQSSSKSDMDSNRKNKPDKKELTPINQIRGMLKPNGPMFSDEDVEEILQQRLAEKFGV